MYFYYGMSKEETYLSSPVETNENIVDEKEVVSRNFIQNIIDKDIEEGKCKKVVTRFPPEPNGYLHIGHAKAIALDFGMAQKYGGVCNLRMDDTNPQKEDTEYVEAIKRDIEWLGFKWGKVVYASDYFQELWDFAVWCIKTGRACTRGNPAAVFGLWHNERKRRKAV